ncbi:hypothetical protein [Cryobacterium sp. Hh38]|uniref:hypothetical protein n=1 Tax=Cryobacterium sp. Hh38 TaxID=1259156 RepID=UPI00106920E5|nr:hypothetical protein [Cryobacterium sp. Hh38]TFD59594.1 hypothetical protein E3T41_11155 [Cryobacterium sp. Hh38]
MPKPQSIDESRLSERDYQKLAELQRGQLGHRPDDPSTKLICLVVLSILVATGLGILGIIYTDWFTNAHAVIVLIVVVGPTIAVAIWYEFKWAANAKQEAIAEFIARINKEQTRKLLERLDRDDFDDDDSGGSGSGGAYYPITGHYDPQRYYSYTRGEREIMRIYGMDADTYDSNWPQ